MKKHHDTFHQNVTKRKIQEIYRKQLSNKNIQQNYEKEFLNILFGLLTGGSFLAILYYFIETL